jgi:hypothetical protein
LPIFIGRCHTALPSVECYRTLSHRRLAPHRWSDSQLLR